MTARLIRRVGALAAALLCAVLLQLAFSPVSQAHSVLLSSNPEDGQVLAAAPASLSLQFSEAVEPSLTVVRIEDSHGVSYPVAPVSLVGTDRVLVALGHLPDETYRISWKTVASDDRHQTSGVVVFGIGTRAQVTAARPADPLPGAGEAAAQWAMLIGLGALAGSLLLVQLGRVGSVPLTPDVERALTRVGLIGGVGAIVAMVGVALIDAGGASSLLGLLSSPFGQRSLTRLVATGALLAAAGFAARSRPGSPRRRFVLIVIEVAALVTVAGSTALLGHAAGSPLRATVDAIHLLFAIAWCGSLLGCAGAVLVLSRRRRPSSIQRRELVRLLTAFGVVSATSVGVLIVTGLLLAGGNARTVDSLALSTYGRVLLVKLILAVGGGLLGLLAHRRLRRRRPGLSVRAMVAEAVLLMLVLGAGAALASTTPPRGAQWRPAIAVAGSGTVSGEAAGLVESLKVLPNVPGHNFVTVAVFNTRRPAPAPITAVLVQLSGPGGQRFSLPATAAAGGEWVVPTDAIDGAGAWTISVRVSLAGRPEVDASYPWEVAGSIGGPAHLVISQRPASSVTVPAAFGLAAVLALIAGGAAVRRRRSGMHGPVVAAEDDIAWDPATSATRRVRMSS